MNDTRIEISVKEYQNLKDKISELEKEIVSLSKDSEIKESKIESLSDSINYMLYGITAIERIFQWKYIKNAVIREIGSNDIKDH